MPHEAGHILRLHHAAFQQLGAADDALQGRFQLVGDVGGELPAVALGEGLLRHVEGQQHRAHRLAVGLNAGHVELVLPAILLHARLGAAVFHGVPQGAADGGVPLHRYKGLSHTGTVGAQHRLCRRVDAQHRAAVVQKHKPLGHAGGDLLELLRAAAQGAHLLVDLPPLVLQTAQQGRQLLVGLVFQRVLQIQAVQRLHDPLGDAAGQQAGQDQRRSDDQQDGLEHPQQHGSRGDAAGGQAQHRAVRQTLGVVEHFGEHGVAVTAGLTGAVGQCLPHLLALGVVLHGRGIGAGVVEHHAVGTKPCDAVIVGIQTGEIGHAVSLGHGCRRNRQLVLQLLLLQLAEVAVQRAHDDDQTGCQHRKPHRHGGAEYLFCHVLSSQR